MSKSSSVSELILNRKFLDQYSSVADLHQIFSNPKNFTLKIFCMLSFVTLILTPADV
jgi:hypothetical protein